MTNLERTLAGLQALGRRFAKQHLSEWDIDELCSDWFRAALFFLNRVYLQGGRTDRKSISLYNKLELCLEGYFPGPNRAGTLERLRAQNAIPSQPYKSGKWSGFQLDSSPLWQQLDEDMGRVLNREMVLDAFGFFHSLQDYNIVSETLRKADGGQMAQHRQQLMTLRGVGPKTSALYLRDVVLLSKRTVSGSDRREVQPVDDPWVKKFFAALPPDIQGSATTPGEWLSSQSENYDAALLNAGAWYVGINAPELLVGILGSGATPSEALDAFL